MEQTSKIQTTGHGQPAVPGNRWAGVLDTYASRPGTERAPSLCFVGLVSVTLRTLPWLLVNSLSLSRAQEETCTGAGARLPSQATPTSTHQPLSRGPQRGPAHGLSGGLRLMPEPGLCPVQTTQLHPVSFSSDHKREHTGRGKASPLQSLTAPQANPVATQPTSRPGACCLHRPRKLVSRERKMKHRLFIPKLLVPRHGCALRCPHHSLQGLAASEPGPTDLAGTEASQAGT